MLKLPGHERSLWRQAYIGPDYPQITGNVETDVAVIGAGITGLSCAYFLKQAGLDVVVLEKRTVGAGTTGRTTGKVTSQHGLMYDELLKESGPSAARNYGEANEKAIDMIERIIKKERIDCGWQRKDNFVFTTKSSQVKKFKSEAKAAESIGLPASYEVKLDLPFPIAAAVKFSNQATFHSQRYLLGLAKAVNGNGSLIFENSHVTGIRDGSPGRVKTATGMVTAKHIIVATSVPTLPLVARGGYCLMEYPTESYIVAGKPAAKLEGMYISPDRNHYSILPVSAGGEDLLLIGGGGHVSGMRLSRDAHYAKLAAYAHKHFAVKSISYKWSDRDYIAYDRIPLIGKLFPWSKNLYVATAYKKWGLTTGTVAGMLLRDLIKGKPNQVSGLFSPKRSKPIRSIPKAVLRQVTGN